MVISSRRPSGVFYQNSSPAEPETATNQLVWKSDAWFSSLQVAGNDLLKDDQQQAYRLRLGVEGNRAISLDNEALLTPSLGLLYRYEGGDDTTGRASTWPPRCATTPPTASVWKAEVEPSSFTVRA